MLSTGGMLRYAEAAERELEAAGAGPPGEGVPGEGPPGEGPGHDGPAREAVVATEVGMLYGLQKAAPELTLIPANAEATCAFMKMITLPALRDSLAEGKYEVRVPEEIAERARVPIERMVAIG
jgi:quinolinate synthase